MIEDLLKGLKSTLNIPQTVTVFDNILKTYVQGSKSYVDSILDQPKEAQADPIYKLTIIYLAQFYYLNRQDNNTTSLPVTINSLLNRLKDQYLNS